MKRRELLLQLAASPFSIFLGKILEYDIPTEWLEIFKVISSVRIATTGELAAGIYAGLLIRSNEYHIILSSVEDKEYTTSVLIHEAWHAQQHKQGRRYYGTNAEREAWSIQALCLASINPSSRYIAWLWEQSTKQPENSPIAGNPIVECRIDFTCK